MEKLSTNYIDYITDIEYDSIGTFSEEHIKNADWHNRRREYGRIPFEHMALYLLVTEEYFKLETHNKFNLLNDSQKNNVKKLIDKYITQYHKNIEKKKKEAEIEKKNNLKYDLDNLSKDEITYEHIKDLNWDNKKEVAISYIMHALKNATKIKDIESINLITKHISSISNKRQLEILNTFEKENFEKFGKELCKEEASKFFSSSELGQYLDDGNVLLFVSEEYNTIIKNAFKRGLPLEDENASRYKKTFYKARLTMVDLLKRTGQPENAQQVLKMTLDNQPDTIHTHLDREIEKLKINLELKFKTLSKTKITNICRTLKDFIKDEYIKNYKGIEASMKYYKDCDISNVDIERIIGLTQSLLWDSPDNENIDNSIFFDMTRDN